MTPGHPLDVFCVVTDFLRICTYKTNQVAATKCGGFQRALLDGEIVAADMHGSARIRTCNVSDQRSRITYLGHDMKSQSLHLQSTIALPQFQSRGWKKTPIAADNPQECHWYAALKNAPSAIYQITLSTADYPSLLLTTYSPVKLITSAILHQCQNDLKEFIKPNLHCRRERPVGAPIFLHVNLEPPGLFYVL